jgi:hypothetical protein
MYISQILVGKKKSNVEGPIRIESPWSSVTSGPV